MNPRPSHKELNRKLTRGRELLRAKGYRPVDFLKLSEDFSALGLFSMQEQTEALIAAFSEVNPTHYRGTRPPVRAFEEVVQGAEVLVFVWHSESFKQQMYLKFCLYPSDENVTVLHVFSLHKDEPEKAEARRRK